MEKEIWKDIDGYNGIYQVSNFGNVRTFRVGGQRNQFSAIPRNLKRVLHNNGYEQVVLHIGNKANQHSVHRLVLETFLGPCPSGMEACHNNGIRTDNRSENLRWDTRQKNILDKREHGTMLIGEKNNKTPFVTEQILEIRERAQHGESFNSIARHYRVAGITISRIVKRKVWTHI